MKIYRKNKSIVLEFEDDVNFVENVISSDKWRPDMENDYLPKIVEDFIQFGNKRNTWDEYSLWENIKEYYKRSFGIW